MVTGANPTPRTVPEFLTGRHMQPRENLQRQESAHNVSPDTIPPVPETTAQKIAADPFNSLAEGLVGMKNKASAQTLMVHPASTNTLPFDGNKNILNC